MITKRPDIAILLPCYNEAQSIAKVIADFRRVLPEARVYVYDNNSTDGTSDIAAQAGAIVRKEPRQGKGNVVRSMFADIDADIYIMADGDDTYPAEDAPRLIKKLIEENADMVVGDRLSSTYFTENKRPFHNSGNRLVRSMINRLFDSDVHDILSGYRAFSREFVKNYPVLSKGFEIETEMTIHALDRGYQVCQTPVNYRDRQEGSESKLNTFTDGFRVMRTLINLYKDYRPMRFFTGLSILSFVFSMALMIPVLIEYWHTRLVPRFPSLIVACTLLMLSILLILCGLILTTISRNHRQLLELIRLRTSKR